MARISRVGQRFGRLVVVKEEKSDKWGNCRYMCECDCGISKVVSVGSLTRGVTKSCGCFSKEKMLTANVTHGMTSTVEYKTWVRIKTRCLNKHEKNYRNYGGRGINVCNRWLNSFENFYADMGKRPSSKHSIDRIDNNGDYCPKNCRWATRSEQARNKRNVPIIEYNGELKTMAEWSEITGIKRSTIAMRIHYGWGIDKTLSTKVL